jgi:beta-glucosidase-like glycosyl hydrolase/CubicO group peptidase (beta-lactamase class C family)
MRKNVLLFVLSCIIGCHVALAQQVPNVLQQGKADSRECKAWVDERLSGMSLKEKIGQLFIHTVAPLNTPVNKKNIHDAIKEYKVGGLLFSGGQLSNQILLTNYAQELAEVPLFITFDGEWGLAMRLKGTPSFPKNRVLGCIQDNELLYEYGKEVARQCKELGVQINFAPVADVDINPRNPVINTRSFGGDPKNVAQKVIAYSRGLEDEGVLSVSKHFPGHGDTEVDSHKALPVLNFNRARLDSIELYPFREAIKAGLGGVMVGHLEVPELGERPASISPQIINNLLCQELGFQGLVFTDALEMKGISPNQTGNICAQALMAGNDLLLAPRNLKRELDGVLAAVKSGKLSEELITEKCRKVLTYKYALGLKDKPHIQLSGLEKRLNRPETKDLILRLQKAAVTVATNAGGVLPLNSKLEGTVVLNIGKSPSSGLTFFNRLQNSIPLSRIVASPEAMESIKRQLLNSKRVIVVISSDDYKKYRTMLNSLPDDLPVIYVYLMPLKSMLNMEEYWKKAAAVVLGHSGELAIQERVADVMAGKAVADGRLSVAVADLLKPGDGVTMAPKMLPVFKPEDYGMSSKVLKQIDEIALEGIKAKAYPGCQILILKDGKPIYDKSFGTFTYESSRKVEEDDLYDLASLTKTTATLLAVMKLYDEGRFGLTDRISRYVPALKGTNKERVTIEELLLHQSGIPAFWPFYKAAIDQDSYEGAFYKARPDAHHHMQIDTRLFVIDKFEYKKDLMAKTFSGDYPLQVADSMYLHRSFRDSVVAQIGRTPLKDRSYRYSCLNFMLLKEMVENMTKMPISVYLEKEFYGPMGMTRTSYLPLRRFKKEEIVPTVKADYLRKGGMLQGYVHDESAAFMGGVSGNAGLFSTARDVAKVYQMLIDGGIYEGRRYLSKETCDLFLTHTSKISRRGLGFDKPDMRNTAKSPCAAEAPKEVVGHTGFTGTCAWADPKNHLVYVFLSNRIYPRPFDHKQLMRLNIRPRIQQVMYQAVMKR